MKRLDRKFFNRPTVKVAQELLGKLLVRRVGGKLIKSRIIEAEAYCGIRDKACHASKGLTERTKVMFGPPGYAYVYIIYGMYHCLNIVTEKEGNPSAVLIRSVEIKNQKGWPEWGPRSRGGLARPNPSGVMRGRPPLKYLVLNGPGKLCRELKIDKKLNAVDLTKSDLLWVEDGGIKVKKSQIKKGKRIGVDYAGKWKDKLWRFYL